MSEIYYPRVPWTDDPISSDPVERDRIYTDILIHAGIVSSRINRDGIFGPVGYRYFLRARDNKRLKADTRYLVVHT